MHSTLIVSLNRLLGVIADYIEMRIKKESE
jgi:hypothetical protein